MESRPRLPWRELGIDLVEHEAAIALERPRAYDTTKSHETPQDHKMRYKRLVCASSQCKEVVPSTCPWEGKVLTCLLTRRTYLFEVGEHYTDIGSPRKKKLSERQKQFCRELAAERLRPQRIRNVMARKVEAPLSSLPSLQTIQNFVNYYARTKLENHDHLKELQLWIHARAFCGTEAKCEPFTFSWEHDRAGKPVVGTGADTKPFLVGITTKVLIRRLTEPSANYILHLDATFKMTAKDFPVLVVGISDRNHSLHLVALFAISQRLQWIYEGTLSAIKHLFQWVTGQHLELLRVMGDAEDAQYNAVWSGFGNSPRLQFLMFFSTSCST
ncbi:hypothetical protein PHYSODRAFT_316430 [Phytophthora sojae]|uniref:MULE transposase domain-containing protein n=1 Tax=Phytophthora sojae (strain P6497) TaxID=1094619 RepID=G4ZTL6_PHYSP|nr:hypothetical protein PHYSODRAFT_316430 [Phytophthora sojae]EGZ12927.1 hypothetical protein PHYSODRAFT_316430 [Phytophthora sojae]|eukprot:XP_009530356.1 hypothetical protein PHYSODRAFT_316430 [Phytophthora sojae]